MKALRRGVKFVGAASSDAPDKPGLMHQPGVIEVASSESHSAPTFAVYAPGREISDIAARRALRFRVGGVDRDCPGHRRRGPVAGEKPRVIGRGCYQLLRDTSTRSDAAEADIEHVDACAALMALVGRGSCRLPIPTAGSQEEAGSRRAALSPRRDRNHTGLRFVDFVRCKARCAKLDTLDRVAWESFVAAPPAVHAPLRPRIASCLWSRSI